MNDASRQGSYELPASLKTTILLAIMLTMISLTQSETTFRAYPLGNDYFQKVYLVNINRVDHYLSITCKESNMLSISLTKTYQFIQSPRFNIYGNDESPPKMAGEVYTFLSECRATIKINTPNLIEVRRQADGEVIFGIKDVTIGNMHNKFMVIDPSVKWGLGQRFQHDFHVKDGKWTLWNRDKPWKIDGGINGVSENTYGFQPIYLAKQTNNKYHISYFKNTHGLLIQAINNTHQLIYNSVGGNIHFILILGQENPETLIEKYHQFIGKAHIPPFWSLGYHQSRWGYKSLAQIQEMIQKHNLHNLPLDTVWSDLEYMNKKMIFTINQQTHSPSLFNSLLQKQKLHFVPLLDVGISINDPVAMQKGKALNVFLKSVSRDKEFYQGEVWPGRVHFVDYLHPNATSFWIDQLERLYDKIKFSGIWLDMNEPSNFHGNQMAQQTYRIQQNEGINMMTINVDLKHYSKLQGQSLYHREVHTYFGHLSTVATYEFLKKRGRPFIITRSNSVGTGYFAGHWTGDNVADWHFLRLSISGNFLYQIFGMQMVGADICGFYQNTTEQLCSRWMQLGSFYPFSRNHNHEEARSQEAYSMGQILLKTSSYSLKTRYALLKQLYTILLQKKGKGSFFRPLFFQFYDDDGSFVQQTAETQILIGKYIMIAPIVYQNSIQRKVYFPGITQKWYKFQINPNIGKVQFDKITPFKGKSSNIITNQLPSAPPTFLRSGYLIFTNYPEKRSSLLNNSYHIFAALKDNQAIGEILALRNFNEEDHINMCITQNCLIKIQIKNLGVNSLLLMWNYDGNKQIFSPIKIVSLTVVSDDKKWQIKQEINISALQGSQQISIKQ